MHTRALRIVIQSTAGIAVGMLFLWLAFRGVDLDEVRSLWRSLEWRWLLVAMTAYALAICVRVARWRGLLLPLHPTLRFASVAETLVLGYAVNNVLPARLGEVYRAHYAKQRFRLSRSAVLGSIVVERMLDGLVVVCFLTLGLWLLAAPPPGAEPDGRGTLGQVATAGLAAFGLLLGFAALLRHPRFPLPRVRLPEALARRLRDFRDGFTTLRGVTVLTAGTLSIVIWTVEGAGLWCVLRTVGVTLEPAHVLVITGTASLSTLIPTAPVHLGTLQYAFVLALGVCGVEATAGVVAASVSQVFIYGGLTLAGSLIFLARHLNASWVRAGAGVPEADTG